MASRYENYLQFREELSGEAPKCIKKKVVHLLKWRDSHRKSPRRIPSADFAYLARDVEKVEQAGADLLACPCYGRSFCR